MIDLIETYFGIKNVKNIVEAGACDCADSVRLAEVFPNATIHSFECNPETLPLCREKAKECDRIKLTEKALSDESGTLTFYPIDTKQTVTSHENGNPGASSFFKASGLYPVEKYVQDETKVEAIRFDSLDLPAPDFIWLDAQGSELKILKGFGEKLKDVKFIKIEVLFKEQYIGAPLFAEVEEWLDAQGFRFVRFLEKYEWFGDAVFLNKNL